MKVSHTELIDRPVAEVWKSFEDPDEFIQWQDNLLEFEQIEGAMTKVGSTAHMKVKQMGMTNDLTVTVLSRDGRKRVVEYRYDGAQAPFEVVNSFTAADGGTAWTAVLELKLNFLTKALGPVLKPLAQDLVKRNGKDFKRFMERSS